MNRVIVWLCVGWLCLFGQVGCVGSQTVPEPFSWDVVGLLALREGELPEGYQVVSDRSILGELGMTRNPDYISSNEHQAIVSHGGMVSFAAIYGRDDEPRLIVNGIFFKDEKSMEEFLRFQMKKRSRLTALVKETETGAWLLLIALDPTSDYRQAELISIERSIEEYQRRLNARELANNLVLTKIF